MTNNNQEIKFKKTQRREVLNVIFVDDNVLLKDTLHTNNCYVL